MQTTALLESDIEKYMHITNYSRVPNKRIKFSKFFQPSRLLIFWNVSWDNNKKVILKCNCSFNFEYATFITTFERSHFTFFPAYSNRHHLIIFNIFPTLLKMWK